MKYYHPVTANKKHPTAIALALPSSWLMVPQPLLVKIATVIAKLLQ